MLRTAFSTVMAGAVLLALAGPAVRAGGPAAAGQAPAANKAPDGQIALKKALLTVARNTYEQFLQRRRLGLADPGAETYYLWSRRWLDAQLDLAGNKEERAAAYRDHLGRMRDVEQKARAQARAGQAEGAGASAAEYFRLQAELWLARAK